MKVHIDKYGLIWCGVCGVNPRHAGSHRVDCEYRGQRCAPCYMRPERRKSCMWCNGFYRAPSTLVTV